MYYYYSHISPFSNLLLSFRRRKKKAAAETQPTKNTPDDVQLDDKEQKQALLSDNKE